MADSGHIGFIIFFPVTGALCTGIYTGMCYPADPAYADQLRRHHGAEEMGVLPGICTLPGIMPGGLLCLASSCIPLCSCYNYDHCFLFPVAPQGALPAAGIWLPPFIAVLVRPEAG